MALLLALLLFPEFPLHAGAGAVSANTDAETKRIIEELEKSVPELMRGNNIPGISIALIRNARIVWVKGFGVRVNGEPEKVDADTVFEAASFSKPLAAFGVMLLVQDHLLNLDDPVRDRLPVGYFDHQPRGGSITLRHLLSHSSGLSNNLIRKNMTIHFDPGSRFSYSGVGYNTMQKYLESATGKFLDDYMAGAVFGKIGMASSGYVYRKGFGANIARGHFSDPIGPGLLAAFAVILAVLAGLVIIYVPPVKKLIKGRTGRFVLWVMVSSAVYCALINILPVSATMALFSGIIGIGTTALSAILVLMGRGKMRSSFRQKAAVSALLAGLAAAMIIIPLRHSFPSPERRYTEARAASSLYTTPRDMARFLVELMEPRVMRKSTLTEMISPQARINAESSWGLGVGIHRSERGDMIWHWGHQPDYQNFFIADLQGKNGIVIMTNSTNGLDAVQEIVRLAMGEGCYDYWRGIPYIFFSF